MLDYMINPIKMGGLVKEVKDNQIKVHLHGRLGVITVPNRLVTTKEKLEAIKANKENLNFKIKSIDVVEEKYIMV